MTRLHQADSPWAAVLRNRDVRTLAPAAGQRWLRVDDGCLWVTRKNSHGQRDDDIWLCSGGSLELPAHSSWVLEAWPAAEVSVLQQPVELTAEVAGTAAAPPWWRPAAWLAAWRSPLLHA